MKESQGCGPGQILNAGTSCHKRGRLVGLWKVNSEKADPSVVPLLDGGQKVRARYCSCWLHVLFMLRSARCRCRLPPTNGWSHLFLGLHAKDVSPVSSLAPSKATGVQHFEALDLAAICTERSCTELSARSTCAEQVDAEPTAQ